MSYFASRHNLWLSKWIWSLAHKSLNFCSLRSQYSGKGVKSYAIAIDIAALDTKQEADRYHYLAQTVFFSLLEQYIMQLEYLMFAQPVDLA